MTFAQKSTAITTLFGVLFKGFFVLYSVSFTHSQKAICWEYNVVPFQLGPGFSVRQQDYIKKDIGKINNSTCLFWTDMDETTSLLNQTGYVRFEKATTEGMCTTTTIYNSNPENTKSVVILLADECFQGRHVLHELLHALGFKHEHQRLDRDCYVWVSDEARKDSNYRIRQNIPNIDRFPYDKKSIMHYIRSSDLKALSERFYEWEPLGNEEDVLSDLDLWKIQYRFCGRPHYCEVNPQVCKDIELKESQMNCRVNISK